MKELNIHKLTHIFDNHMIRYKINQFNEIKSNIFTEQQIIDKQNKKYKNEKRVKYTEIYMLNHPNVRPPFETIQKMSIEQLEHEVNKLLNTIEPEVNTRLAGAKKQYLMLSNTNKQEFKNFANRHTEFAVLPPKNYWYEIACSIEILYKILYNKSIVIIKKSDIKNIDIDKLIEEYEELANLCKTTIEENEWLDVDKEIITPVCEKIPEVTRNQINIKINEISPEQELQHNIDELIETKELLYNKTNEEHKFEYEHNNTGVVYVMKNTEIHSIENAGLLMKCDKGKLILEISLLGCPTNTLTKYKYNKQYNAAVFKISDTPITDIVYKPHKTSYKIKYFVVFMEGQQIHYYDTKNKIGEAVRLLGRW